jgi:hypothetical protein
MEQSKAEFEYQVRKGIAKTILREDWDVLIKRNDEKSLVDATLAAIDAVNSREVAQKVARKYRWRKRLERVKRLCRLWD